MADYPYDFFDRVLTSFYVLEAIIMELEERQGKHPLYTTLLRRAKVFRKGFHNRLARTMRDSLAGMALGEARYCVDQYSGDLAIQTKDGCEFGWKQGTQPSRGRIYDNLELFSISDAVLLKEIFGDGGWSNAYGGDAWAEICNRVAQFEKFHEMPTIYCDLVFHVVHNGGCAFSKGLLLQVENSDKVSVMLDSKFEGNILKYPDNPDYDPRYDRFYLCNTVYDLYRRTRYLIYLEENIDIGTDRWIPCDDFKLGQVKWANSSALELVERENYYNEYDESEDDYYDEEYNECRCRYCMVQVPRREHIDF